MIQIHKRKIYIRPTPKKDIPQGLVIQLNKPREEKSEPFVSTDILAGQKEYALPNFPRGIYVVNVFIKKPKDEKKATTLANGTPK